VLRRVDGEEPLVALHLGGGGMDLEFERGELSSRLLSFGLTDKQASQLLSEFERHSFSLDASQFAAALEKFGHSRASAISLLRELGASERDLLSALAPPGGSQGAIAVLKNEEATLRKKAGKGQRGGKAAKKSESVAAAWLLPARAAKQPKPAAKGRKPRRR
jgi:hypothetical protein